MGKALNADQIKQIGNPEDDGTGLVLGDSFVRGCCPGTAGLFHKRFWGPNGSVILWFMVGHLRLYDLSGKS
jgi:hypothetical protein